MTEPQKEVESGGTRISRYAAAILALFLPFVVYGLFPSAQFDSEGLIQAYRGEVYGLAGASNFAFWNATCLFGGLTSALVIKIWSLIGHPGDSLGVIRFFNVFCGGLCALILFWLLRTLNKENPVSLLVSLLFSFSSGIWLVCTNIRNYPVDILVVLLNFCYLFLGRRARCRPLVLGFMSALGYFFHVTGIVFIPVVLTSFFLDSNPFRKKALNILYYLISLAGSFLAIFYGIYLIVRDNTGRFFGFFHYEMSGYILRRLEYQNFNTTLSFYMHKVTVFCSSLMSSIVFGNRSFYHIVYDSRIILIVFLLLLVITMKRLIKEHLYEVVLCILWFLCSSAAFIILDPGHPFIIVAAIPLFILLGLSAGALKSMLNLKWKFLVSLGIGILLVMNFYANFSNWIYRSSLTTSNEELSKVLYFRNNLLEKDCVVALGVTNDGVNFLYFARCDVVEVANFMDWKPKPEKYPELMRELRLRVGRQRVFLYSPHLITSDYDSLAAQQGLDLPLLRRYLRENFSFKPYISLNEDTRLIRLTAKPSPGTH